MPSINQSNDQTYNEEYQTNYGISLVVVRLDVDGGPSEAEVFRDFVAGFGTTLRSN